ncbi:MAG: radical SAM protein [Thermodesulfovibrionales bacterium]
MKVMLLSLPGLTESDGVLFPLGIGYLAGSLKKHHDVEALHFNFMNQARKEVPAHFNAFKPSVVGLTCSTFNRGFVGEMIGLLKDLDKDVKIVVGGVHATYCYDQILIQYGADVVVIGEGERTLVELCDAFENTTNLDTVRGIAFKKNNKVIKNLSQDVVANLNDLPMPDYSYARRFIESSKMGFIITSRGCPVRCTFCSTSSFWGQKVRMNSVTRVVDEMEMLIAQFNVKKIFFHDDTFNLGVSRVKAICREIMDRGIKIKWACSCRVVPVSEEMIAAMVEAGCIHICWGIESGSEEMLKRINKKITLSQIRSTFELSSKFSDVMSTGAFAMVGNPGETAETIQETVNFLRTIPMTDLPGTSVLYVLPGTLLYDTLKREGRINDEDWARYDTVPYYTIDNSFRTMTKWAKMVSESTRRVPFDRKQHFWYGTLKTSDLKDAAQTDGPFGKILRMIARPRLLLSTLTRYFSAGRTGRIRF